MLWFFKKSAESKEFTTFEEWIMLLRKWGWSDQQIEEFMRMSHQEIEREAETQREYEAELTPEQRQKGLDHYSQSISDLFTESWKFNGRKTIYDKNKEAQELKKEIIKQKAKKCADILEKVFWSLKSESPLKSRFDVYGTDAWWDAITQAVDKSYGMREAATIFDWVKWLLEQKWLSMNRPAYDYFVQKERWGGVWLDVGIIGEDTIREKEIEKRAVTCAKVLEHIYTDLSKENTEENEFDLYENPFGKDAILQALAWYEDGLRTDEILKKLVTLLEQRGYICSCPTIDYFMAKQLKGYFYVSKKIVGKEV